MRRLGLVLATALVVAGGCAAPQPRTEVPASLPNTTQADFLTFRWALVREAGTVRAVGTAVPSGRQEWDATVALEGVDSKGEVLSRGTSGARAGFTGGPAEFQVELVPKGGEADFRLRVVDVRQFVRGGGRELARPVRDARRRPTGDANGILSRRGPDGS